MMASFDVTGNKEGSDIRRVTQNPSEQKAPTGPGLFTFSQSCGEVWLFAIAKELPLAVSEGATFYGSGSSIYQRTRRTRELCEQRERSEV